MNTRRLLASLAIGLVLAACSSTDDDAVRVPTVGATTVSTIELPDADTIDEPDVDEAPTPAPTPTEPTPVELPTTDATADTAPPSTAPSTTEVAAPATTTAPAPPTTAATIFYRQGDEAPEIEVMQLKLLTLGYYSGQANGVFDGDTNAALRTFQGDYGLGVDGVFGPLTDRALTAAANSVVVDDADEGA